MDENQPVEQSTAPEQSTPETPQEGGNKAGMWWIILLVVIVIVVVLWLFVF